MDLIYTDSNGIDQGVLLEYELDMEIGGTDDFELKLSINDVKLEKYAYIYSENTEILGILDKRTISTADEIITYAGKTARGILKTKIVEPQEGEDYRIVSGSIADIMNAFMEEFELSELIEFKTEMLYTALADYDEAWLTDGDETLLVVEETPQFVVSSLQINRYVSVLEALDKMLEETAAKLTYAYVGGKMIITLSAVIDYSDEIEFGSNQNTDFVIEQRAGLVNHLICLGKGELADRQVLHLYMDASGNISKQQSMSGIHEVAEVYDYSSAESIEELEKGGIKKLKDQVRESIEVMVITDDVSVGDIVGGRENITGINVKAKVTSKIIRVKNNNFTVEYKVGE